MSVNKTNGPVRIGVVGCGYWGPNLIRNFRNLPDSEMRVMCDMQQARLTHLQTLYPEVQGTTDYAAMVADENLDAIAIATPVGRHHEMAKASLLAGKHTFIEKPMAKSSAECEELIAIAKSKGLALMVGHTFLYSAPVRRMKEIIEAGDIGQVRYLNCRRLNLGLFQKDINVTWDLAPHDISIVLHIMGESPATVSCNGRANVTPGVEDVTNMCMTFPRGGFAIVQSSWLDPRKVREITIVGARRMIVYDDLQTQEKLKIFDMRVERPPHYDTFAEFHYAYHYGDIYTPFVKQEEPLKVMCQHFLDCIRKGLTPFTDGRKGLQLVRILEAASESLREHGKAVQFDAASDQV